MVDFDTKFEEFYKLFEEKNKELSNNDKYNSKREDYTKKYESMLAEPEIPLICEQLIKLGEKYNFNCTILLDGLYSNQKYQLHESHYNGPFKVVSTDSNFKFLENKIYANASEISKEITKEKIRFFSDGNGENFSFVTCHGIIPIFRCKNCNYFDGNGKSIKSDNSNLSCGINKCNTVHNDYVFYEGKPVENIAKLNGFYFASYEIYDCVNCRTKLIPDTKTNMFYALIGARVDPLLLDITSSGGGSISMVTKHATLVKA
jgi:hypothetical protein